MADNYELIGVVKDLSEINAGSTVISFRVEPQHIGALHVVMIVRVVILFVIEFGIWGSIVLFVSLLDAPVVQVA